MADRFGWLPSQTDIENAARLDGIIRVDQIVKKIQKDREKGGSGDDRQRELPGPA